MRSLGAWITAVLVALTAAQTRAEDVNSASQDASTSGRLRGADTILLMGGGLFPIGGSALRYRAKGSQRWETLHRQPGDALYRVEADDSGRVLAAWEKDPFIHFFTLQPRRHTTIPKPPLPSDVSRGSVDKLAFLPDGRHALVFMEGSLKYLGERHWTAAYRIALDGKPEPELLFRVDDGFALATTVNGAVFIMPKKVGQRCNNMTCDPITAIVGYAITPDGVRQTPLLTEAQMEMGNAWLVPGSNDERAVLMVDLNKNGRALLRWRYGDAKPGYRPLPRRQSYVSTDDFHRMTRVTRTDELIEIQQDRDSGSSWWIVRHLPEGGVQETQLPAIKDMDSRFYGFGQRAKGGLWLHVGDHLVLHTPGKPLRRFSIEPYIERFTSWAGQSVYHPSPESLWVGLEVRRSRDFLRVNLADVEKRAAVWR